MGKTIQLIVMLSLIFICSNVMGKSEAKTEKKTAYNSTFAIGGVSCSADSFVVKGIVVLRMNNCAEKPAHRKSANRQVVKKLRFYQNLPLSPQQKEKISIEVIKTLVTRFESFPQDASSNRNAPFQLVARLS